MNRILDIFAVIFAFSFFIVSGHAADMSHEEILAILEKSFELMNGGTYSVLKDENFTYSKDGEKTHGATLRISQKTIGENVCRVVENLDLSEKSALKFPNKKIYSNGDFVLCLTSETGSDYAVVVSGFEPDDDLAVDGFQQYKLYPLGKGSGIYVAEDVELHGKPCWKISYKTVHLNNEEKGEMKVTFHTLDEYVIDKSTYFLKEFKRFYGDGSIDEQYYKNEKLKIDFEDSRFQVPDGAELDTAPTYELGQEKIVKKWKLWTDQHNARQHEVHRNVLPRLSSLGVIRIVLLAVGVIAIAGVCILKRRKNEK